MDESFYLVPTSEAAKVEEEVEILNESLETSINDETFIIDQKPFEASNFSSLADGDEVGVGGSILSKLLK